MFLTLLGWAAAAVPVPAAPPTAEQVARWVRDLGADDYSTRRQATDALWRAGAAAEPALEAASQSKDAEVARRAREVLDRFRTGVYPDTPASVLGLVRRYQATDPHLRQTLVREFCREGRPGLTAIRKLAALEEDTDVRRGLLQQVAQESGQAAGILLADGDAAGAEEMLEATLDPEQGITLRNYAAYFLLRGTLDDKAGQLRARVEARGERKTAAVLAYLYRAKGDLAAARWAAERAGDGELLEGIVAEQGDWKALLQFLAKKPARNPNQPQGGPPGLKATYLRLARDPSADAELRKLAEESDWTAAVPLCLNDRPQDAISAFERGKNWNSAFEFLTLRLRYREALELAERATPVRPEVKLAVGIGRARTLARLGEREKARQELSRLTDELKGGEESSQYGTLLKLELELDLKDEAYAHAARILTGPQPERFTASVCDGLFGDSSAAAALWWGFVRERFPKDDVPTALRRLRDLFDAHKPGPDFEALAAAEADVLARQAHERDQSAGTDQYERDLTALADVCAAAGKEALAQTYLEKAAGLSGDASALARLADFLAERGRWTAAAERYGQAWEKDRGKPLPLYLRGWALGKAGRGKEGQPLLERAHLLALADENGRYELAEALSKRGLAEAAEREFEMLLRTGEFQSVYRTNAFADLVSGAERRRDYFRAADYYQRVAVGVLEGGAAFLENSAYLTVPHAVHLNRAHGLVAAGRFDEARKEIDVCLTLLPGDSDLPLALVPELAKRGRKADADDLYARVAAVHEKLLADYPRCAASHNELAWLAARCRRDLDRALEHARKAVELAPRQASYLDTLAEVYFQRGDRDRALELMNKCREMEPKKDFYRQQLRRYEAGDPAAEVPD